MSTFSRPHHRDIATVLGCLDAALLREHNCLFGGGTAISLRFGEYRESLDIDFMVSDAKGFKRLREKLSGKTNLDTIMIPGQRVFQDPEIIRTSPYAIRTQVRVGQSRIKFEIISEGNLSFDAPSAKDMVCGITTLTTTDLAACKILANSDRYLDDGTYNRDIIDLAMIPTTSKELRQALAKTHNAYGKTATINAHKAIERLLVGSQWLDRCINQMSIEAPPAELVDKLRKLDRAICNATKAPKQAH
jgi:hypothetical protein